MTREKNKVYIPTWMFTLEMLRSGDNIHKLSRQVDVTYPTAYRIITRFKNEGWILMKRSGGKKAYNLELTTLGKNVQKQVEVLLDMIL